MRRIPQEEVVHGPARDILYVYKGEVLTDVCLYQNLASVDAIARMVTGQRGLDSHRVNFGLAVGALFSVKRDSLQATMTNK